MAFEVARITVELLRPVPVEPLLVEADVVRPGRKVQLVEATVRHAAIGHRGGPGPGAADPVGTGPLPEDPLLALEPPPDPGPSASRPRGSPLRRRLRRLPQLTASSTASPPGPGSTPARSRCGSGCWCRWWPARSPAPLQRVAAAADFGNGVSRVLSWETHMFINPELTVHLLRPAVGRVDLPRRPHASSAATASAWPRAPCTTTRGRIGRSVQSLLVEARLTPGSPAG